MANARANGADKTLGRQALGGLPRLPPPDQGRDDDGVAGREDPEGDGDACGRDDQAAERRPGGAPDIEADAVQGRRAIQILPGHEERSRRPHAGEVSAPPTPSKKVVASKSAGDARSRETREAKITETARIAASTAISNRRESMTSARAPAGRVNRNRGKLTATWTRDTVIGLASRLVISQPDAVSNMAVPTFDRTLAVHITVNAI